MNKALVTQDAVMAVLRARGAVTASEISAELCPDDNGKRVALVLGKLRVAGRAVCTGERERTRWSAADIATGPDDAECHIQLALAHARVAHLEEWQAWARGIIAGGVAFHLEPLEPNPKATP